MEPGVAFTNLGVALLLGLLVGLQRERNEPRVAGLRTFGLITVLGAALAIVAQSVPSGAWLLAAGMVALIAALIIGNVLSLPTVKPDPGITTEIAALVMYVVGVMLVTGPREAAVVLGGSVAILLQLKRRLQSYVSRLGEEDVRAIFQFVLLTAVILPIVPDRSMGPYDVLNPRQIWLMVVLVVGISLGGYLLYKLVGQRTGLFLSGVLGGLISSTATTVSYARRAGEAPEHVMAATFVITAASSVMYARLLVEIGAAAPDRFMDIAPPVGVVLVLAVLLSVVVWRKAAGGQPLMVHGNPTELKPALIFAAVYAVVLVATAAAHDYVGNKGIYAVAVISGLTDMDAITLSSSRLASAGTLETSTAWRAIVVASMANMVFKFGMVAALGGRGLAARVGVIFAVQLVASAVLLAVWPR